MQQKHLWIAEDDPDCLFMYKELLSTRFSLTTFSNLEDFYFALKQPSQEKTLPIPDGALIDIRFKGESFLSWMARKNYSIPVPFMVVSAVDDIDILRLTLQYGAHDYLTKPFGKAELLVRLEKLLHISPIDPDLELILDPLFLTVTRKNIGMETLTLKEFQIFSSIYHAPNQYLDQRYLMNKVWGQVRVSTKTLDVHVCNLRRKLQLLNVYLCYSDGNFFLSSVDD